MDADTFQPDDLYVAGLIRIEAAQRHERASYTGKCFKKDLSRSSTRSDSSRSTVTSIEDIELISQIYRPLDSSSMTPMERFAVLSPANDPCPWESGRMIARIGLEEGSIDMLDVRVDAAIIAEATRKSARFSKLSFAASS
jgi:hypothetical protein